MNAPSPTAEPQSNLRGIDPANTLLTCAPNTGRIIFEEYTRLVTTARPAFDS